MGRITRSERLGRLLAYTCCAWLACEALIATGAAIAAVRGLIGDPEMKGLEAVFFFPLFLAPGMLLTSFGLLLPGILTIQALTQGKTQRLLNVAIGAALVVPVGAAWTLFFWTIDSRHRSLADFVRESMPIFRTGHVDWIGLTTIVAVATAGMIVGAGAQARGEMLVEN
jgi:hypothetical protein